MSKVPPSEDILNKITSRDVKNWEIVDHIEIKLDLSFKYLASNIYFEPASAWWVWSSLSGSASNEY